MNASLKKLTALLLAVLSLLTLVGCGEETRYDYNLEDYLTVADLSTITVSQTELDEEMETTINSLLEEDAETKDLAKGDVLEDGDETKIDFTGKMNGETFSGGSGENYALTLGSGSFIEGFESGLVGVKVGDTVTLNLKFPDDYRDPEEYPEDAEKFNGKDVEFEVTVNSATRNILPELTDDFVKEHTSYETVEAYKEELRTSVIATLAMEAFTKKCRVTAFPEKEYDEAFEAYFESYKMYATYMGVSVKTYVEQSGSTMDEFYENLNTSASTQVKQEMIYYYLARENDITVSDEEYEEGAAELAKDNGYETVKELQEATGYTDAEVYESLLFQNVNKWVVDQVTVVNDVKDKSSDETSEKTSETTSDAASSEAADNLDEKTEG